MLKLARTLAVFTLILSLVACGKTEDEKAKDKADSLVSEQNSIANDLSSKIPNSTWTIDELNSYASEFNRLEAVESELNAMNGDHGVLIAGADNSGFISRRRDLVGDLMAAKMAPPKENLVQEYNALSALAQPMVDLLVVEPEDSWTDVQIDLYISKADELMKNIDLRIAIIDKSTGDSDPADDIVSANSQSSSSLRSNLVEAKDGVVGLKQEAEKIVRKRAKRKSRSA